MPPPTLRYDMGYGGGMDVYSDPLSPPPPMNAPTSLPNNSSRAKDETPRNSAFDRSSRAPTEAFEPEAFELVSPMPAPQGRALRAQSSPEYEYDRLEDIPKTKMPLYVSPTEFEISPEQRPRRHTKFDVRDTFSPDFSQSPVRDRRRDRQENGSTKNLPPGHPLYAKHNGNRRQTQQPRPSRDLLDPYPPQTYETLLKRLLHKVQTVSNYASEHDVVPGWSSPAGHRMTRLLFLRFPIPYMFVVLAIAFPAYTSYTYINDPPKFDISLASFTVPEHHVARLGDAVFAAEDTCVSNNCLDQFCVEGSTQRHRRRALRSRNHAPWDTGGPTRIRRADSIRISLVYRSLNGNMITPDNVRIMHAIESKLAAAAVDRGFTPTINSLTKFFFPANGRYNEDVDTPSDAQVASSMNMALDGTGGQGGVLYPATLGETALFAYGSKDMGLSDGQWSAEYLRAEISGIGGSDATNVRTWITELENANSDPDQVDFMFASSEIFSEQIMSMLLDDAYIAMYALIFVVSYMLFHTGSLFLTLIGLLNTVGAFPVGYGLYREIFGHKNLSILTVVTLFIVIGIAVDDVFVFIDMFRQQDRKVKLEERMVRTMTTAARSTLFTTVTSASAFAANTLSEVPALSNFGLLTALVIASNYFLLILVLPPTLAFWWTYLEPLEAKVLGGIKAVVCCPCHQVCPPQSKGAPRPSPDRRASDGRQLYAAGEEGLWENNNQRRKNADNFRSPRTPQRYDDDGDVPFLLPGQTAVSAAPRHDEQSPRHRTNANGNRRRQPPGYTLPPKYTDDEDSDRGSRALTAAPAFASPRDARGNTYHVHGNNTRADHNNGRQQRRAKSFRTRNGTRVDGRRPTSETKPRVATALTAAQSSDKDRGEASLFERLLYHGVSTVAVRGRTAILLIFVLLSAVAVWQGTLLQPATEPPQLVKPETNLGKVQKLSSSFAEWDESGGDLVSESGTSTNNQEIAEDGVPAIAPTGAPTAPTQPPTPAPTLSPTASPTIAVSIAPTPAPTTAPFVATPAPTAAPVGAVKSSNTPVSIILGLVTPFVDRSHAETTSFTEQRGDYLPIFLEDFNTNQSTYTLGMGQELMIQFTEFCFDLLNDTTVMEAGQDRNEICEPYALGYKYASCSDLNETIVMWFEIRPRGLFDSNTGASDVLDLYSKLEQILSEARTTYPELVSMEQSSLDYERATYEKLAIDGSIMGIACSLLLCFIAVVLFKAHMTVIVITMIIILGNVAVVVAFFYWNGWTLGGVEAVSLSILVGTCVDYCIHMVEGYLEASPDNHDGLRAHAMHALLRVKTTSDIRHWRVRQAIASVGVPVVSAAITTAGSAAFLTLCNIQLMARFGEILVLNTCVSLLLTLTALPAMLACFGPASYKGSIKRFLLALVGLGVLVGVYFLVIAAMEKVRDIQDNGVF
eukprot:m.1407419 g.1407419  ORF g.1407419 m.1407419 type:complete len:1419 (+) comp25018_c0_seq4:288-4544(+)